MSIRPTQIIGDTIEVIHDDACCGAVSVLPLTDLRYESSRDGKPDRTRLQIECPMCGSVSTHPITGGSHPEMVQRLFAHVLMHDSDDIPGLGSHPGPGKQRALAEVKGRIREMCGAGYRLSGVQDVTGRPVKESERIAASDERENEPMPLSPVSPPSRRQDLAETIAAAIRKNPDAARIIAEAIERA